MCFYSGSATRVCGPGGYQDNVWRGYFRLRSFWGGRGGQIGLSIMADIDHNCMKRCDSREMCMASLSLCPNELAEACGGMSGVESLCAGIDLSPGFGDSN